MTERVVYVLATLGGIALIGLVALTLFGSVNDAVIAVLGNVSVGVVSAIAGILSQRSDDDPSASFAERRAANQASTRPRPPNGG